MSPKETPFTTSSPPTVHASPVTNTGGVVLYGHQQSESHHVKQGHSFLGCCCDMRRAVIIINTISVVLTILFLILLGAGVEYVRRVDNDTTKEIEGELTPAVVGATITIFVVGIISSLIGIYGALKYRVWAVAVTLLWYGADLILSFITLNIMGIAIALLFIYPHVVLIQEMRSGIMTQEAYPAEEQSCCCV